jgi:selenide,water dikinase
VATSPERVRLTTLSHGAGCACKISASDLREILSDFPEQSDPDLLVRGDTADDAAVYRVSPDLALVQSADFFTPIVDDPYTFGAIAAANSMSDIYAMGGDVAFALNVVAFPNTLDPSILSAILQGGADKVAEGGGVIAGGHTVTDPEPKYGLAVTGFIHPDRIWRKAGAVPGDVLLLTKPIGTGVISTALKNQQATDEVIASAVESMLRLNRAASEAARPFTPNACTDITGFGLLGHGFEMAERSGVQLCIDANRVPFLAGAKDLAAAGQTPGGLARNLAHFAGRGVTIGGHLPFAAAELLYDPQTSGGLLFSLPPERAELLEAAFERAAIPIWRIGTVESGTGIVVN